ncbi:MAG TPA: ABC transporter ATP-binding protein [bacterium]|jgi:branched-chain amino acid transport system ATP-binding protein|nr:ABC transporter ATP-binding protein [bacterium]
MENILELKAVEVAYGAIKAVQGLTLCVPRGKIVCLIGANGAGKSSTLRAISGLEPFKGSILFKSAPTAGLPVHHLVRRGLVHCPEGRGVLAGLSVEENLDLGAYTRGDPAGVRSDRDHVFGLFPRLAERVKQKAETLSGGEQQMLALGRALMARPELLLLDEPSLGLAPQVTELILETVSRICSEGVSVLLVEQNAAAALEIGHYAYVLETGRLALEGPAAEVARDERVRMAYLGE